MVSREVSFAGGAVIAYGDISYVHSRLVKSATLFIPLGLLLRHEFVLLHCYPPGHFVREVLLDKLKEVLLEAVHLRFVIALAVQFVRTERPHGISHPVVLHYHHHLILCTSMVPQIAYGVPFLLFPRAKICYVLLGCTSLFAWGAA
jgi:hypothetical protein